MRSGGPLSPALWQLHKFVDITLWKFSEKTIFGPILTVQIQIWLQENHVPELWILYICLFITVAKVITVRCAIYGYSAAWCISNSKNIFDTIHIHWNFPSLPYILRMMVNTQASFTVPPLSSSFWPGTPLPLVEISALKALYSLNYTCSNI